jgi:5-dehydro-2-deoxygluconokinase
VIEGEIPHAIDEAPIFCGIQVEVLNVLGAGDAFLSGFLSGWLRGEDYDVCAARGNGCGALVVSRHGCAPAMPTPAELDYFLRNAAADPERMRRPDRDSMLAHLHRVTVPRPRWEELYVFAFDHRSQFAELARRVAANPLWAAACCD